MTAIQNIKSMIFSPTEIGTLSTAVLKRRMEAYRAGGLEAGVPLYIKNMDMTNPDEDGVIPMTDELVTIIARPGHGKTSFMMRLAKMRSADIRKRTAINEADANRRAVVYISYEQTIEALNAFHVASSADNGLSITAMALGAMTDTQWQDVERININRMADPLWFIGNSTERRNHGITNIQSMTAALDEIQCWNSAGVIIDSVFVDYLQRMPYDKSESKTIGVSENLDNLKILCMRYGAPFFVGAQATRDVEKRDNPTPGMDDGQWTSNIEQTSDVSISLLRPCLYRNQNEDFDGVLVQGRNQMQAAVLKQKLGPAGFIRWLDFDVKYNRLNEAELKSYNLRKENKEDE